MIHPVAVGNTVSASDLVRQFGVWQEHATREPVYILHRGRPRLVLTSVTTMQRLCATQSPDDAQSVEHALLLDMMREPVIRVDGDLTVQTINPAAEAWLGRSRDRSIGSSLSGLMGETVGTYCAAMVRRASRFGSIETADLPFDHRHATVLIAPIGEGALIIGVERTDEEHGRIDGSTLAALRAAMAAGAIAECAINLRGHVDRVSPELQRLTGIAADLVQRARFVSLFAVHSRVAVGDALDTVLTGGEPMRLDAVLLRGGLDDLPVTLGLAALRPRVAIEGAIATVRARLD